MESLYLCFITIELGWLCICVGTMCDKIMKAAKILEKHAEKFLGSEDPPVS